MSEENEKKFDLEPRTFAFAQGVRSFVFALPKTVANIEDGKQLVRSGGSVGANYIEANESLGSKDFLMKLKICRKEAKESLYWLKLIRVDSKELVSQKKKLEQEAHELNLIFSRIINKITLR